MAASNHSRCRRVAQVMPARQLDSDRLGSWVNVALQSVSSVERSSTARFKHPLSAAEPPHTRQKRFREWKFSLTALGLNRAELAFIDFFGHVQYAVCVDG